MSLASDIQISMFLPVRVLQKGEPCARSAAGSGRSTCFMAGNENHNVLSKNKDEVVSINTDNNNLRIKSNQGRYAKISINEIKASRTGKTKQIISLKETEYIDEIISLTYNE